MCAEVLKQINNNKCGFLSFNTFLSTTLSSDVAIGYAGNALSRSTHEHLILFQIDVDTAIGSIQPLANICEYSSMPTENEI